MFGIINGIGNKKRFPSKSLINNNNFNPSHLQTGDVINVVDLVATTDNKTLSIDGAMVGRYGGILSSFMHMMWNARSQMMMFTICVIPLVASAGSKCITDFLATYNLDWMLCQTQYNKHMLFNGAHLYCEEDDKMYCIVSLDPHQMIAWMIKNRNNGLLSLKELSFADVNANYVMM